ncbi:unnamed protein product [Acanthoscelides obtectus]|uniref:Uncharacterized protein n=1 Tax=Acanthoscelides obtectus TaxID=200917 RepID=A0A9P0QCU9_ACAOB|nr:unnamed protein product [Acanthoscelides obtectus]CAH2017377.1 unnamed protein product [Acanthoscelides obtectus]CAK1680533.1 hypothetical protein AOBTE_LOCUS32734 [Acanthoscelides obtectus]CAK1686718.1 hypothetical protein AOBTE_LOCUS36034 [Acanthoscelides obtectus]
MYPKIPTNIPSIFFPMLFDATIALEIKLPYELVFGHTSGRPPEHVYLCRQYTLAEAIRDETSARVYLLFPPRPRPSRLALGALGVEAVSQCESKEPRA